MKADTKTFRFESVIERTKLNTSWHIIPFPYDVEKHFGTRASVRMEGTINGMPVKRALIPRKDDSHFITIPAAWLKKLKLRVGDKVQVVLRQEKDPDHIVLPEELEAALDLEPEIREAFEKLTPSIRRGVVHWITSGKKSETRVQRSLEVLRRFENGYFRFGGRNTKV